MSWTRALSFFRYRKAARRSATAARCLRCRLAVEALEERWLLSTYDVGPGLAYTSVNAVPWETLGPGDSVRIHWRPEAYREKILISTSGSELEPIRVLGIPGPQGERPVLDGEGASTRAQANYPFTATQDRGLVTITRDADHSWGFKPSHILIEGLDLRDANRLYSFTDANGAQRTYTDNAASIFVERGQHITIKNCVITGSGNGLFVASGDEEALLSRDILVDGNDIYGNGNVGSDRHHNVYTCASGIVFQNNHLGDLRPGAQGGGIKDRSAGTVIRYNWIEGGARLLDLVDPEDSPNLMTREPFFHDTYVYGNLFLNRPEDAGNLIHYGGDSGVTSVYRKGTLHFYNNTVVVELNQQQSWNTTLLEPDTNDESVALDNNILYTQSATPGATPTQFNLVKSYGTIQVGTNWISPGWLVSSAYGGFTGAITGTANIIPAAGSGVTGAANDPGFVSIAASDFHLLGTSAALDKSRPLPNAAHAVTAQYVAPHASEARPVNGPALDLGAFESTGQTNTDDPNNAAPTIVGPAQTSVTRVRGTTVTLSALGADDGGEQSLTYTWASEGPQTVIFSDNGTNTAKSTTATFQKAGVYTFQVTVSDSEGLTATSSVTVTVAHATKRIVIAPSPVTLRPGTKQRFSARTLDQFGEAMSKRPVFGWSLTRASIGTINRFGVYTAPASGKGYATVIARSGSFRGKASVLVTNAKPGSLQFVAAGESTKVNAGYATLASITVTRGGGSAGSVTVHYATSDGSASAGTDYTATSGTLTFANGVTSRTFTVPILNSELVGSASINLTLSSPTGGATLGTRKTAVLTLIGQPVAATTLYVDARNTTGIADGSALHPFTSVQAAVDAAGANTAIDVAMGTYAENVTIPDKSVTLVGGFVGATSAGYAGGQAGDFSTNDPAVYVTRIAAADASRPVIFLDNLAAKQVAIDGFTLSGGLHGVYVVADYLQFADVAITHNVIEDNGPAQLQPGGGAFAYFGGGIYSDNATITIADNVIRRNNANRGGGMFVSSKSDFTILRNVVDSNTGWDDHGGGIVLNPLPVSASGNGTFAYNTVRNNVASKAYSYGWAGGILIAGNLAPASLKPVTLAYDTFSGNFAPSAGGAIFADDGATVILDHELIHHNQTQSRGGAAIYVDGDAGGSGSEMTIQYSTIADNTNAGDNLGNGVYVEEFSKVTISQSIFWGNVQDVYIVPNTHSSIAMSDSDSQQGVAGTGNVSIDPLFTDPAAGDYHVGAAAVIHLGVYVNLGQ